MQTLPKMRQFSVLIIFMLSILFVELAAKNSSLLLFIKFSSTNYANYIYGNFGMTIIGMTEKNPMLSHPRINCQSISETLSNARF